METTTYNLLKSEYPFFVSIPQAAEITGTHPTTWNKWQLAGQMPVPSIVMGGVRRIRLIDLCAYLDGLTTVEKAKQGPQATLKRGRGRPRKVNLSALHAPA